jgi:Heterokaryon incompatibility protein (HET)
MAKMNYTDSYDKGRARWGKPFEYRPLARGEIRLLELLPGAANSVIECRLYHGVPENLPRYEALSYTWGESTPNLPIFIHEKVFLIKDNLKDALRRFRLPAQQKTAKNSAEEFLRYWEKICLCLDYSKEGDVIPHNEGKLVRDVGRRGQDEYERYIRLVQRQDLQLSISPNSNSANETELLLANLEQRRKELQALWGHHATRDGKARVSVNSRLLWIDAICINQADLDERIAQIKIMR